MAHGPLAYFSCLNVQIFISQLKKDKRERERERERERGGRRGVGGERKRELQCLTYKYVKHSRISSHTNLSFYHLKSLV